MILGIAQFRPLLGEVDKNLKTMGRLLNTHPFNVAVLPELATTGYFFASRRDLLEFAEDKNGKSFCFFEKLAEQTGGAIVWGVAEKCGKRLYNSAVLTTPEGDHHIYRKTHLFFREKLLFDPGNTGFRVVTWRRIRIGVMVCFDWIYPESARVLALNGAQIICHPANLVLPYCQDAMITRSLENRVFCATANRTGTEMIGDFKLTFTGRSQITDPTGNRILRLGRSKQAFETVKINPRLSDTKKVNRHNDIFADRRTGYYAIMSRRIR
jgi:predicted amidohydrolase